MTTLDTLDSGNPDATEVANAALAMADFDAKEGDFVTALDWLAVAEQLRKLPAEYAAKKLSWGSQVPRVSADGPERPALPAVGGRR